MIDQHRAAFVEEATELLGELETTLLTLEENPRDREIIDRVFRALHTIKGSGAMFGFDAVAAFTHELETAFDRVRRGELEVSTALIELTLAARDHIRDLLDVEGTPDEVQRVRGAAVVEALLALCPRRDAPAAAAEAPRAPSSSAAAAGAETTYRIRFKPPADIFLRGGDPSALMAELAGLGALRFALRTDDLPPLEELDPEQCRCSWEAVLTTSRPLDDVRNVFVFFEDDAELRIDVVDVDADEGAPPKRLGEILVERGDVSEDAVRAALATQRRIGDVLIEQGLVSPAKVHAAAVEQKAVQDARTKRQTAEAASSVRVAAERLDQLVNLVGELVTVQARFSATAQRRGDQELAALAEEVERLTWELRDTAMNMRMLPMGATFAKFRRLVRDLARDLGKEVELETEGAETELDKTVIDRLGEPLVHLVRNAVDHGIEAPEARAERGKPRAGTVRLSAAHMGASVVVEVRDDGAGLDAEAIRAKAIERGLLPPGAEPSEQDLFALIFHPGFSTAKQVSSVSGRGVGMDVVKQAIDALHGQIEVRSRRGEGTTVAVKLPLTLAIIDGLLVGVGGERYVLPLSVVQECVELTRADAEAMHGRRVASVRGRLVPYVRLRELFDEPGERPAIEQIVIVSADGREIGLVVDHIVGEHQTVIKSLGRVYKDIVELSGSTILGDGSVALILDVPKIVERAENEERALTA